MPTSKGARGPLYKARRSRIHGRGVFAARRIRKGTRVIEYTGERVTHDEADRRYEDRAEDDNHTFLFIVDGRTVIDAGVGGNDARFINHSCDPNCETLIEDRRVFIHALRTIQAGEELSYDYQIKRAAGDPPGIDDIYACRCGAAGCRGTMLIGPRPRRRGKRAGREKHAHGRTGRKA